MKEKIMTLKEISEELKKGSPKLTIREFLKIQIYFSYEGLDIEDIMGDKEMTDLARDDVLELLEEIELEKLDLPLPSDWNFKEE